MPQRFASLLIVTIFCTLVGSLGSAFAATPWSGLTDYTIQVGSYQRTYHVHLPPTYTTTSTFPLVVGLHGSGDTGSGFSGMTNFNAVADLNSVIAVYPDAIKGTWNSAGTAPQDDFAFISAMILQLRSTFSINSHRIYAVGFSNGGDMTEELGCRMNSTFAAISSVSGHMPSTYACPQIHPMPLITFHGSADPIWSYAGWANTKYGQHLMGALDAENKWAALAACKTAPTVTNLRDAVPTDGTTEQLRVTTGCTGGVQMQLYTINNGGHTWPGGLQYLPVSAIGLTSLDISASTLIWQFFAQYQY